MDAFESVIAMLLRREGWWTELGCKVALTRQEKLRIDRPSTPRWEVDIVAYRGATNELMAVECKSYLDSPGVHFDRALVPAERYKLFTDGVLRTTVLQRLAEQMVSSGACAPSPTVKLGLAVGKVRRVRKVDHDGLRRHFDGHGWWLWLPNDIRDRLAQCVKARYENDVAHVVAKLMGRC